jgi:hypothetical protein
VSAKLLAIEPEPPVSSDVIEHLTMVCDWVRDDKVSSVAIAVVHRDGSMGTVWSHPPSYPALIGAVERLKYRLMKAIDE